MANRNQKWMSGDNLANAFQKYSVIAKANRSMFLLVALVAVLVIYPFLDTSFHHQVIRGLLNCWILATAAFAIGRSLRVLIISVVLAVPVIATQASVIANGPEGMVQMLYLTLALFFAFTVAQVLAYVLRSGVVTSDRICAAISAYILLALLWTSIYVFLDATTPGSFDVGGVSDVKRPLEWADFLFFSFTTLTTTGYGNIVPVSAHAQSISILEQLAGTFFVAILIARLAGLYEPAARPPSRYGSRR